MQGRMGCVRSEKQAGLVEEPPELSHTFWVFKSSEGHLLALVLPFFLPELQIQTPWWEGWMVDISACASGLQAWGASLLKAVHVLAVSMTACGEQSQPQAPDAADAKDFIRIARAVHHVAQ